MSKVAVTSFLSIVLTVGSALAGEEKAQDARPNIVLILADDMGFSDLGCYGSEISTPNLDKLAQNGWRFTQFYNTGRCCPTRASLLTGLYPHQAGVGHMVENRGRAAYEGFLNDKCVTIAEVLRKGGYRTSMSGKWHVGEQRPHWPVDRGFERFFGLVSGGSNYFRLDPTRTMAVDDKPYHPPAEGFYMTDAITEHAIHFLEDPSRGKDPFFLYVAYTAPHWPLHALPEDIAKYRGKYLEGWDVLREQRHRRMVELGIVDGRWPLTPRDGEAPAWIDVKEKEAWDLRMAVYAAQIDRLDQGIGKIMAKLEELGALKNTLILFLSDNGGSAEVVDRGTPGVPPGLKESFMSYGLPWANASNTPFRLYKHWVHEGGIATPLIAHWPAGLKKPGAIVHEVGHLIDILPTCLEAAGVEYPKTFEGRAILPLEGKSLLPLLRGGAGPGHDALFWEHEGNKAVRLGKWKAVSKYPGGWELYDLEADRTELKDLAAQHPEKVSELKDLYARWAERSGVAAWEDVKDKGPGRALDIYFIDTEGGAATLIVTPLKESLLVDSGNPGERDAERIALVAKEVAGLKKLDHLITTHWHRDHVGGVSRLSEMLPIKRFYDHGVPGSLGTDILPGDIEAYQRTTGGKSKQLRPGDQVELRQDASLPALRVQVLASDGLVVGEAPGAPQVGPCSKGHEAAPEDASDNARSVALLLTFGDFSFFDGGDLTWNGEHRLVCPVNLVGAVDVFQVDHHGLDLSNHPALVQAIRPRVAVMLNGPRKGGEPRTFATLKGASGLESIFQLHRNVQTSENAPSELVANDEEACHGDFIKLSVESTGTSYSVAVPAKGTARTFATQPRTYSNVIRPVANPRPLLADHPDFVSPVVETARFEAPPLVDDLGGDLEVRAWRFSYNARGIIEMPNRLRASETAVIVVHPWGIDDGRGWRTPEPAGVADFCTLEKNHLAGRHTREVINPFLKSLRGKAAFVLYSLPGDEDPIRGKLYRSFTKRPAKAERQEGARELAAKLTEFSYKGEPLAATLALSREKPVVDYFKQFPGLDAGPRFNNAGFWELPIPVTKDIEAQPNDVVIYDAQGYEPLRKFLKEHGVRHVLLTGYATDMCFCRTTAGYENLERDFNLFLVGDATLATFPANASPALATNAAISFASLNHLITQVSWVEYKGP